MPLPLNKRHFDVFLSHAHKDSAFVSEIDQWLSNKAGLSVWYDAREMPGGSFLATDLQSAMDRCRGILLLASDEAVSRGWVKAEYNCAMDQRANEPAFRVVALRMPNANVNDLMKGTTWIDVPERTLDPSTALSTLRAFYPGDAIPNPKSARDVYVSCSWHNDDSASARAVCRYLASQGLRLVGDAKDQEGFGKGNRVERIIASCGAFVCIVPFRNETAARTSSAPYKYFLHEMDYAESLGIPSVIVADPRVRRDDKPDDTWYRMETHANSCEPTVATALQRLDEAWRAPPDPQYIFFAVDFEAPIASPNSETRHLIERITGMPTLLGNEIHESPVHASIIEKIQRAFLVIGDITDEKIVNNVNVCIEAGAALGAGTNVRLVARGKPRRPPYMLSHVQTDSYETETEHIGLMHRIARQYRRRILNVDLL